METKDIKPGTIIELSINYISLYKTNTTSNVEKYHNINLKEKSIVLDYIDKNDEFLYVKVLHKNCVGYICWNEKTYKEKPFEVV